MRGDGFVATIEPYYREPVGSFDSFIQSVVCGINFQCYRYGLAGFTEQDVTTVIFDHNEFFTNCINEGMSLYDSVQFVLSDAIDLQIVFYTQHGFMTVGPGGQESVQIYVLKFNGMYYHIYDCAPL